MWFSQVFLGSEIYGQLWISMWKVPWNSRSVCPYRLAVETRWGEYKVSVVFIVCIDDCAVLQIRTRHAHNVVLAPLTCDVEICELETLRTQALKSLRFVII